MLPKNFYSLNNKVYTEDKHVISVNNRSFRYGDGFFETIKIVDGEMKLMQLHFNRISKSLALLQFQPSKLFTQQKLEQQIIGIATKNNHHKLGRIRVTFFRNDGGLFDALSPEPNILIQSFALLSQDEMNQNGLVIDIYEPAKKSCDMFSNIKSNNYLPYAMAALWAKQNKLNDALLININNTIADSTIANIFIIKNKQIITPALSDGCVDGVMRKHIINTLQKQNINVLETSIAESDLLQADEVFLTNAIKGIIWVKQFKHKAYTNIETIKILSLINKT